MRIPWLHRFGRRSFLGTTAAGLAGVALIGCEETPPAAPVTELDHPLILGSGFGGSITAHRLAQAGIRSTVLERGRRWVLTPERDTFCSLREPDERAAWFSTQTHIGISSRVRRYAGVVEQFEGDHIDAVIGAGVGGGSLVYAGMMVQPPRDLFEAVFPSQVSYDEMLSTWYPRVSEMMPSRHVPDDVLMHDAYAATRLFLQHAETAGINTELNYLAVDWDIVRMELSGELPAENTAGDYVYGVNNGAKVQADRTYLAAAEATGLCAVRPLHQVLSIAPDPAGGYLVDVEEIDEWGEVLATPRFRAPVLFLCAGSIHSTRLLVEARARGDLPMLSSEVGEGWGQNGQHIYMRNDLGVSVPPFQGGPPTAVIRDWDNPIAPVTIEHGAAAFGYDCGCMILPSSSVIDGTGSLTWNAETGRTELRWDPSNGATAVAAAEDVGTRLNAATGGTLAPLIGRTRNSTFHPLGGVVLARATDGFGRVDGYPGLYVQDGALMPGITPTANPAWTISAIVERNLATIIPEDLA